MLGNFVLGANPLGAPTPWGVYLKTATIDVVELHPTIKIIQTFESTLSEIDINSEDTDFGIIEKFESTLGQIDINGKDVETGIIEKFESTLSNIDIQSYPIDSIWKLYAKPNYRTIEITSFPVDFRLRIVIEPTSSNIDIDGLPVQVYHEKLTPTIEEYLEYIKGNMRHPIYKIEILRKSDESVLKVLEGQIINNSGSISNTLDEGVRRTCDFSLPNIGNRYGEEIENLSIGDKFRVFLGYKIDGKEKYFPQGVFVFDDPTMVSNISDRTINFSGTDKWSMLNGQNGGILEGTYVVKKGSKIGELVRKTLRLNIVGDPIEPNIDKSLENMETTYDITKNAGETISDVLLEVALNVSAYIYYDEYGRFTMYPVDNDMFKSPAYVFSASEYNYLGASKKYQLSDIYNSVLIIGENIKNSNTPIVYEALNNDLSDPNSIPNVGFKKIKNITEYTKGIDTKEKAEQRGNWELKKAKAKLSSVDINCLALYHLDVNQIIVLSDFYLNSEDERFLINSISIPIGTDIQSSISVSKAVEVE